MPHRRDAAEGGACDCVGGRNVPLASDLREITVFSSPREPHRGLLRCGPLALHCALGRERRDASEARGRRSDACRPSSPALPDRATRPATPAPAPVRALRRNDGWCEDPHHGRYNRPIRLPSSAGHETMWREDRLYDIVGVLDWNVAARVPAGQRHLPASRPPRLWSDRRLYRACSPRSSAASCPPARIPFRRRQKTAES